MIKKTALSALAISAIALSPAALANDLGGYVSVQAGQSFTRSENTEVKYASIVDVKLKGSDQSGFAYRLASGYNFNDNVALELGFTDYSNSKTKVELNGNSEKLATVKPYTVELLVKGTVPVSEEFFVYGKTGFAYTHVDFKGNEDVTGEKAKTASSIAYRPVMAAGAGYKVNEQVSVDLSYSRVFGKGSLTDSLDRELSSDYIPDLDLLAVGVSYSF